MWGETLYLRLVRPAYYGSKLKVRGVSGCRSRLHLERGVYTIQFVVS